MGGWLGKSKVSKRRIKIYRGIGDFVPTTVNFSKLEKEFEDGGIDFDPSDDGIEVKRLEDNIEYEEMIVQILCNLEGREKLIFIFQLLRDGGYQIDHGAFAKVVNLSRRQYMRVLEDVRLKSALFIAGYNSEHSSHKESE